MKPSITFALLACVSFAHFASATENSGETETQGKCAAGDGDNSIKLTNMEAQCSEKLKGQIKKEFQAAVTYLAMSAHFSSETSFRPGLSKFFLDSSAEERGHAKKMMEFLLMRGVAIKDAAMPPVAPPDNKVHWKSALEALQNAYELELSVTSSIEDIVKTCETGEKNDYHTVDYLTGEFIAEQHDSLRTISEYITSLKRTGKGTLGELLFDKTLLKD